MCPHIAYSTGAFINLALCISLLFLVDFVNLSQARRFLFLQKNVRPDLGKQHHFSSICQPQLRYSVSTTRPSIFTKMIYVSLGHTVSAETSLRALSEFLIHEFSEE